MPVVDKPLSELKEYMGINPCPSDFQQYWEESLAEMKSLDKNVTLTPSWFKSPVADCYDMYFTGVHGARVYAKLLKPKKIEGKCPAVVSTDIPVQAKPGLTVLNMPLPVLLWHLSMQEDRQACHRMLAVM